MVSNLAHKAAVAFVTATLVLAVPGIAQDFSLGGDWRISAGLEYQASLGPVASSLIEDISGDGVQELIEYRSGGGTQSGLYCVDGATGGLLWFRGGHVAMVYDLQLVHDLDGDGSRDLLVGTDLSNFDLQVLSSRTGSLLWQASVISPDLLPTTYRGEFAVLADLNADGVREIGLGLANSDLGGHSSGVLLVYDGRTGNEYFRVSGAPYGFLGIDLEPTLDFDGDQTMDILVVSNYGISVEVRSGVDGAWLAEFVVTANSATLTRFLGDLDGDSRHEIVTVEPGDDLGISGGEYGAIRCFGTSDGSLLWESTGSSAQERFGTEVEQVGDCNEDGVLDLLVYSPGKRSAALGQVAGGVRLLSGADGTRIRSYSGARPGQIARWVRGSAKASAKDEPGVSMWYSDQVAGVVSVEYEKVWLDPYLRLPGRYWFASSGVSEFHRINFGPTWAGAEYRYLVSPAGKGPWEPAGVSIPLTFDPWVARGAFGAGYPGLTGSSGSFDSAGRANVAVNIPAGALSPLVGQTLNVAAAVEAVGSGLRASSIAWTIEVLR
jgi:hypothetical protein